MLQLRRGRVSWKHKFRKTTVTLKPIRISVTPKRNAPNRVFSREHAASAIKRAIQLPNARKNLPRFAVTARRRVSSVNPWV